MLVNFLNTNNSNLSNAVRKNLSKMSNGNKFDFYEFDKPRMD